MKKMKTLLTLFSLATQLGLATIAHAQIQSDSNITLNTKLQTLVISSTLAGKGDAVALKASFEHALNVGWTINELKEAMVHVYAYAGFPRSLNALNALRSTIDDRKKKGITDVSGKEPTPIQLSTSRLEGGTELQARLLGSRMKTSTADFAPIIDVFLKEHLFWDIFSRDNLDFKTRELITISTLAGLGNAQAQLQSHIGVSMYNGVTEHQLQDWVKTIEMKVGKKEGTNAREALIALLAQRGSDSAASQSASGSSLETILKPGSPEKIFRKGEKITNNNFIGTVWLENLIDNDSLNDNRVGSVTFEPGARSNWHYHPDGQILLALEGTGFYQEKGSLKKILKKGDVVKCPPNVPHWHGASSDDEFVQVAITGSLKGGTIWQQPVTEEEYNRND